MRLVAVGAVLMCSLPTVNAAVVKDMTPEMIAQAIQLGAAGVESCYPLKFGGGIKPAVHIGCVSTPFSRVAGAAAKAKKAYKPFTAADVTPEMIAPVIHVLAFSQKSNPRPMADRSDVVAVVVGPADGKPGDLAGVIQPIESEAIDENFQNAYGATLDGKGMRAVFPIDVVTNKNELRVVFTDKLCAYGGFNSKREECRVSFDRLDKAR
jgi:hypothetical protein